MRKTVCLIVSLFCLTAVAKQPTVLDLSGTWQFALDPDDKGTEEQWYNKTLEASIRLPGSLQEQGYGFDVSVDTKWTGNIVDKAWFTAPEYAKYREPGNIKVPFWLTPDKHYVGVAWYQRTINIPSGWKGKPVVLELERPHWETTLYIDGVEAGHETSLSTPHRYTLPSLTTGKHVITLKVDNRLHIEVGINSHSVSDHTQSNWNGIVGAITLSSKPEAFITDIQVYPNIEAQSVEVRLQLSKPLPKGTVSLQIADPAQNTTVSPEFSVPVNGQTEITATVKTTGDIVLWSEFTPAVYSLITKLHTGKRKVTERISTNFGFREFKASGTRFTVNGLPIFLRGTLECCIFPLTGYPNTDNAYWTKIYNVARSYGLNHLRFHSWCPPKAAFDVADSLGFYLHVECSSWANRPGSTLGDGLKIDRWIYEEGDRIMKEYGNHPSFCILLYGNEPAGSKQNTYLSELVTYWKKKDRRRVYGSGAGWPFIPDMDLFCSPAPRIKYKGSTLSCILNAQPPSSVYDWRENIRNEMPTVSHEIGQWCVFPNFKEIPKYTGVLKAKNFEIFRDFLDRSHLGDLSDEFLYASGKLQTLCYKAEIEAALRTPGFAGFQLLDLHDFPGQGTALVGVLDPFWDDKGYVTGKEYSRFCNRTVPLVRLPKMIYLNSEALKATVELAHFGSQPLANAKLTCLLTDKQGKTIAQQTFDRNEVPLDNCIEIGAIEFPLNSIITPQQLILTVKLDNTSFENSWNVWVYPAQAAASSPAVYVADKWNDEIIERLERGENVLLTTAKGSVLPEKGGSVPVGFSSIFWNTAWMNGPPKTLGIYCNPAHPALRLFPTEKYSDYQWWELVMTADAIDMKDFPSDFRPIVHLIDDWFTNRKLGLLLEVKAGKGNLLICSADISSDLDRRHAAAQLRNSLLDYMTSAAFKPSLAVSPQLIKNLYIKSN